MVKKPHLYRLNTAKIMKRAPVSNKKQKFNLKPSGGEKKKKKKRTDLFKLHISGYIKEQKLLKSTT